MTHVYVRRSDKEPEPTKFADVEDREFFEHNGRLCLKISMYSSVTDVRYNTMVVRTLRGMNISPNEEVDRVKSASVEYSL